jgi:hypothetical protein
VLLCFPCIKPSPQSSSSSPPHLLHCRVQERKVSLNPLDLVVDPAFEPRLDRAM